MRGLVGYTGFVGGNLLNQTTFDKLYNSKNINDIKGEEFDFLVCAGAPAVKWQANKHPEKDLETINILIDNLKEIKCNKFLLISTIDVYESPRFVDENTEINIDNLSPYGKHRLLLENFVEKQFPDVTIIRLPGLFGNGLKKNIIFDFLHNNLLHLIDSENVFQFYNLDRLYSDIQICLENKLKLVNFTTEPVSVKEVARDAFEMDFNNKTVNPSVFYDIKSVHASLFSEGKNDYFQSKVEVLQEIKEFVKNEQNKGEHS